MNPDIKTPLVVRFPLVVVLTTSGVLMSGFFEGLPLDSCRGK